jgi:hypothetical protein
MAKMRILLAALTLAAVTLVAAPVQASPGPSPAPAGEASILAVSPTISPQAESVGYVVDPWNYYCATGRACLAVWDPTTSGWYKVFDLYNCGEYRLSNWYGWGTMRNRQTGGVSVLLYGQYHDLKGIYPVSIGTYQVDWTPIWYVRPC